MQILFVLQFNRPLFRRILFVEEEFNTLRWLILYAFFVDVIKNNYIILYIYIL